MYGLTYSTHFITPETNANNITLDTNRVWMLQSGWVLYHLSDAIYYGHYYCMIPLWLHMLPSSISSNKPCHPNKHHWAACTWWHTHYTCWQMQCARARLLKYMISYTVHLLPNAIHLLANAVHPCEAPEVHYGISITLAAKCNTPLGKCSTPKWGSWSTWFHMQYTWCQMQYTSWQMQYTHVRLMKYIMAYPLHLLANAVHQSEAPETHDGLCSTPVGKCSIPKWGSWSTWFHMEYIFIAAKCSTPKWGSWNAWWPLQYTCWQMQYTQVRLLKSMTSYGVHLLPNAVNLSETPDVHDFICSTPVGKCSTPKWGSWYTWWHIQPVHLLPNAVHQSEAPEVHGFICSTLAAKCSKPKWGSWNTRWPLQYTSWQQCTQVRLLKYMISYAVHLLSNAVHPREAPDVHDGICRTPKWDSWCTWWHMHYTCCQMQYTKVRILKHMMASAVHQLANAAHPNEAPEVHDLIWSTPAAKCSIPKSDSWCTWWHMQYTHVRLLKYIMAYPLHLLANAVHQSEAPEAHGFICSTLAAKCSKPK